MINKGAEEEFPVTWENCSNTGLLKTNGDGSGDNSCYCKTLYTMWEREKQGEILGENDIL